MLNIYLYNAISNVRTPVTYELLQDLTGMSMTTLYTYKSRGLRLSALDAFIIDDTTTIKELRLIRDKVKIKDEAWVNIEGYHGKYKVSNYGRFIRTYNSGVRDKLLMPYIRKGEDLFIKLTDLKGKTKEIKAARIVADHFVENPDGLDILWHKNGNIYDNFAGNLEWTDRSTLGKKTGHMSKGMPVLKLDAKTGEVLDEYVSMGEAGRLNYLHRETIRLCIAGELKTAGGFKWMIDSEFLEAKKKQYKLRKRGNKA